MPSRKVRCGRVTLLQQNDMTMLSYERGHEVRDVFLPGAHVEEDMDGPTITISMRSDVHFWRITQATVDTRLVESIIKTYEGYDAAMTVDRLRRLYTRLVQDVTSPTRREERGKLLTSDISGLMEAVDKRRGDIVPCLLGAPGIGKTEGIEEFARTHGRDVVHIIASQILPTEVSGMTMPNQETHSMDVFDHSRLSHMRDGDILFLDELLKGQQQVLSACLTLVQERRLMSGTHLPDVIIVAAANPLASAKMLPEEIRQRFLFVDVAFDEESWKEYMRDRGVSKPELLTSYLVTKGDGSDWNTLTPRTMTQLTLWYRDVKGDPLAEMMVEMVIQSEFSTSVMNAIKRSLGIEERKRAKPMDEVRDFIRQSMSVLPEPADHDEEESRVDVLKELNRDELDVASLLEKIQHMSGGNAIMEALRNETIDLSITGIGEE